MNRVVPDRIVESKRALRAQIINHFRHWIMLVVNAIIVAVFMTLSWAIAGVLARFFHAQDLPVVVLAITGALASIFIVGTEGIRAEAASLIFHAEDRYLNELATPDAGYFTHRVFLQVDRSQANFLGQFLDVPANRKEIMLVLRQGPKKDWRGRRSYSLGIIQKQIKPLFEDKYASIRPKLQWVCFVTRRKKFVAYMPFEVFAVDVIHGHNQEYETLLNTADPTEFEKKLQEHSDDAIFPLAKRSTPTHILNLFSTSVPDGSSRKKAMLTLIDKDRDEGMLVSSDRKPVGVVSMRTLAEGLLKTRNDPDWVRDWRADKDDSPPDAGNDERFDHEEEDIEPTQKIEGIPSGPELELVPAAEAPTDASTEPL